MILYTSYSLHFLLKKMIAFMRRNFIFSISKHTSPPFSRSPVSLSPSPHFFSSSTETQLAIVDLLLHKHEFPPELASRVASELTKLKTPENANSVLSFFKDFGFSNTQIERILKYKPRFLAYNLEGYIKPKFKIFQDVGFSPDDICKIISINPAILCMSLNNKIVPSISLIKGLVGSGNEVGRVIRRAPRLLTANLDNSLVPNVEFLKSCGIPVHRIRIVLSSTPHSFLMKPELVRRSADVAKSMGIDADSKGYIYGIITIAGLRSELLELKLQAFLDLGFSDRDVRTMISNGPQVLSISVEKMKKVKEVLLGTGKFDLGSIVNYPMALAYSVEKRYVPRLRILGILESRDLIEEWPALSRICTLTDFKFFEKFICPYLNEISDVY